MRALATPALLVALAAPVPGRADVGERLTAHAAVGGAVLSVRCAVTVTCVERAGPSFLAAIGTRAGPVALELESGAIVGPWGWNGTVLGRLVSPIGTADSPIFMRFGVGMAHLDADFGRQTGFAVDFALGAHLGRWGPSSLDLAISGAFQLGRVSVYQNGAVLAWSWR